MTPRERLLTVLRGETPDCVPVAPDFSNMIPARLTGKPFWDLYLYNDPPIWETYIDCARHFDIDSLMDGYFPLTFPEEAPANGPEWERFIIEKTPERIVTRRSHVDGGRRVWSPTIDVFPVAEPAKWGIQAAAMHLPPEPERYEPPGEDGKRVLPVDTGPEGLRRVLDLMGDQGLVGVFLASTCAFGDEEGVYRYYDNPDEHERWAAERIEAVERRFELIAKMEAERDVGPDFLCVGGSGTLVFQTEEMFRRVAFPAVRRAIELASAAGFPTHVHSCGPERKLVQIMAEETGLTVIDPLEAPPMGDCDLAELKVLYGGRIVLKGNLHTTDVMLRGSVEAVIRASRRAIDDAAPGGRFILSTGDQCGRDTPDANLRAMVETARDYGRY
jgi:uroporphyrinogen decarboxylase